jgi:hypothetical protein
MADSANEIELAEKKVDDNQPPSAGGEVDEPIITCWYCDKDSLLRF